MDDRSFDQLARRLGAARSRRQVLGMAGRGTIGGLGAALAARSFGPGYLTGVPLGARAHKADVEIADFAFDPDTIEIAVGGTVTWTNKDDTPHTVTADDGAFDSGELALDEWFSQTFPDAGTYPYHCDLHPKMTGTVVVGEATSGVTRENVHHLDPDGDVLDAFATALGIMKSWDLSTVAAEFQRSMRYQANSHETWFNPPAPEPAPPNPLPAGWSTCEHSGQGVRNPYFWPWHRMELYWFERIVRELSGYAKFALPYWDYADPANRILPAPFLDSTNDLWVFERDPDVNGGLAPGPSVPGSNFDYCLGLSQTSFEFASIRIESTPHGGVHNWVGGGFASPPVAGLMGGFATAARDPVFWIHHANIDRLWESWLALGNSNPPDPTWEANDTNFRNGRTYDFFDESGTQVTTQRSVGEILPNVVDLGYVYEELADLSGCPEFMIASPGAPEAGGATPEATVEFGANAPEGGIDVGPEPADVPVTLEQPEAVGGGSAILTVEGIRSQGVPAVIVEVYVNKPSDQEPDFRSPYYVGNLNLFGLLPSMGGEHDHAEGDTQQFDIAANVRALEATDEWTDAFHVEFVPYYMASTAVPESVGATPEALATPPGPWVTIESVTLTG